MPQVYNGHATKMQTLKASVLFLVTSKTLKSCMENDKLVIHGYCVVSNGNGNGDDNVWISICLHTPRNQSQNHPLSYTMASTT